MKRLSLAIYLNVGIALVLAASAVFIIVSINDISRKQALYEAEEKAKLILNRNLATHTYFSKNLKPPLFKITDPLKDENYFEPSWMSSTYAVREIDNYFKQMEEDNYYYKECAINARSPENEADKFERTFIEQLNANPDLEYRSLVREFDDGFYFVTLRRGESMEEGCLRCHSTPDKAPDGLVEIYGPERSFNRKVGDVISAISIRVPISESYARADKISKNLSLVFISVLMVIFAIQYLINKLFVSSPIGKMRDKALQIIEDENHLGEEIMLPAGKELYELAQSFNSMSKKIRDHMDSLEENVRIRTIELENANIQLKQKMEEVVKATQEKLSLENRLRLAKKMESIGTMAGGIAHNFNNILGTILGYADMVKESIPEGSKEFKYIDRVLISAHRAERLVKQILIFSQQEESQKEIIEPGVLLAKSLEVILKEVPKNIEVEKNISTNLGRIEVDSEQFKKVVKNLCMNAFSAMQSSGGVLGIDLENIKLESKDVMNELYIDPGDFVRLSIRDTGVGIPAENLERIFDPFYTTKKIGDGDGIGLSIVHGIMRKSNGMVKVESEEGKGAIFYVYWPVAK